MHRNPGFTLIELMVTIAIVGILSSIVVASLGGVRTKARDTRRIGDLRQITTALELYYEANGFYPASGCGWDCNGYRYSYDAASWGALTADLAPYIILPSDSINSACPPWGAGCYSYSYGNVGRTTYPAQYDLTASLETVGHPLSSGVKNWTYYFNNSPWTYYSNQVYEASF